MKDNIIDLVQTLYLDLVDDNLEMVQLCHDGRLPVTTFRATYLTWLTITTLLKDSLSRVVGVSL